MMKTMFLAVARARKDAKALSHALGCETLSLGGIRNEKDIDPGIFERIGDRIPLFFSGREDERIGDVFLEEALEYTPLVRHVKLKKKAVRNARMEEIRESFELEKAKLRLYFEFKDVFLFSRKNGLGVEINPDYDAYFVLSDRFARNMRDIFGVDVREGNLIVRKLMNEEWIYSPRLKAVVSKKIGEECKTVFETDVEPVGVDVKRMAEKNEEVVRALEKVSISFLRSNAEGRVAVPFSGGKDSLASLLLARKAFDEVSAIYVKTNYELPFTEEYVEDVCERLGVELIKTEVTFNISSGMPTLEDRWCTKEKMSALAKAAKGFDCLVVGDRDAESRFRRERPEIVWRVSKELFPLKYWSGCHVQLYSVLEGIELHPLYYEGFYRLGCSICPSMSEWELNLLEKVSRTL